MRLQTVNACITEENGTIINELLGLVSQEDQKQKYLLAHQTFKKIVLTQRSIVQIIHCDLSLKCLVHLPM